MIQFSSMKFKNMVAVLYVFVAISAGAASSAAFGATFTATSRGGDSWTLSFNEDTITTSTSEAIFCNARQAMIIRADLWMPSMGHGSSPVALFPQASGCTAIRNLNFMMRGDWDVRVWLNNNDSGVFSIEVR
ncbi:hypothetical protein EBZ80_10870 [bacterium]|nr:hypothetical protein [bacterium]